jgi:hypothetical protein
MSSMAAMCGFAQGQGRQPVQSGSFTDSYREWVGNHAKLGWCASGQGRTRRYVCLPVYRKQAGRTHSNR